MIQELLFATRARRVFYACLVMMLAAASLNVTRSWRTSVFAQEGSNGTAPSMTELMSELQTRLKRAQSETELDPAARQQVIDLYQAAIERLEIANEAAVKTNTLRMRLASVGEALRKAKVQLASTPTETTLTVSEDDELSDLEQALNDREKQLGDSDSGLRQTLETIEDDINGRMSRLEEIMNELSEIDERLDSIEEQLDAPPAQDESREVTHARRLLLLTRQQRANQERAALVLEQEWFKSDLTAELLRVQRDVVLRQIAVVEAETDILNLAIEERRGSEADKRIREAELVVTRTSAIAKPVAQQNLALAKESKLISESLAETGRLDDVARNSLSALETEFSKTRKMVESVGLTESIGLLLRQQRAHLTDTRNLWGRIAKRGETVRDTKLRLFQIEGELASLRDLDAASLRIARELTLGEGSTDGIRNSPSGSGDSAKPSTSKDSQSAKGKAVTAKGAANSKNDQTAKSRTAQHGSIDAASIRLLVDELKPLLERRRLLLQQLNDDHDAQFNRLVTLDNGERMLLKATNNYADFIDERVLWIRTGSLFGATQTTKTIVATTWLLDHSNWMKVVDAFLNDMQESPLPYAFAAMFLVVITCMRWSMKSRLRMLGTVAAEPSCRNLLPTVQATVLTLVLAAVLPATLAFVGWRIDQSASLSKFVNSVAAGLMRAAMFAVPLELLRLAVQRGGLAEQHFDWSPESLTRLRRHLRWFLPVGIVLVGLIGMIEANADEQRLDSLGRAAFMGFAAVLAVFSTGTIRNLSSSHSKAGLEHHDAKFPSTQTRNDGRVLANQGFENPQDNRRNSSPDVNQDAWVNRLAKVGQLLGVILPVMLLVLGFTGYLYTALQLTWRLLASAWLGVGLLVVRSLVLRWITLERRRMAQLHAEELQAIAEAGKTPETESNSPFLFPRWTWPDFRMNLTQIVTQIRSLLDTGLLTVAAVGLWFVWADVAPALHILDRVPLWQTTVMGVASDAASRDDGAADETAKPKADGPMVKQLKTITASNLGVALLIMFVAMIAGRNIPGLVEVILHEHFSVDAGVRFATTCIVRYVIFIAGVCLAFNQIGIGWDSVQWLVAAASVGLGFGLQEIFANFVSGIILLFERPMRVGDVVTVGDTTGTVSRIRFRATTIIDGDRKELIVPNKSFITGNLLNWTLSDSINRLAIRIHVSASNNPSHVRDVMLALAAESPLLLKDPAPTATLEEIGPSGLLFVLRGFLPTLKERSKASNDLFAALHARFIQEGIELPRSSQDVYVRILDDGQRHEGVPSPHLAPQNIGRENNTTKI